MTDLSSQLSNMELSSIDLDQLTGFDPRFIEWLLSISDDLRAIASHVEPPPGAPSAILRDDLDGIGDVLTAPTSNQAYILDQKTISNALALADVIDSVATHLADLDNPHKTSLINLKEVLNENYIGLPGAVPVVQKNEVDVLIQFLSALDIVFNDDVIGSGEVNLQGLLEYLDGQTALRETVPSSAIVAGGDTTRASDTTIDISAGDIEVIDAYTDRRNPVILANIVFPGVTGFTIDMPDLFGIQSVYIDLNGTILQTPGRLTNAQRRTLTRLCFVDYADGVIGKVHPSQFLSNEVGNLLHDLLEYFTPESRLRGLGINVVTNALSIFGETGTIFVTGVNHLTNILDPNVEQFPQVGDETTPVLFDVKFSGNLPDFLTGQTVLPKFYESAPGVATALSGNDAAILYIYRTFNDKFIMQLGTNVYTNGATARDALEGDLNGHVGFTGSDAAFLLAQAYVDRTSTDFNDQNKAGIVSLIGSGAGSSGSISVTNWIDLTDTDPISYTGLSRFYSRVNASELGLDLVELEIFDDKTPILGGELNTNANHVVIDSAPGVESGRIGTTATGGSFLAKTTLGAYDPNDGGLAAEAGIIELHGGIAQVKTLAGADNREVWVNQDGSLFAVIPPAPGFSVSDTDNGNYALPTLGVFVRLTGLQVIIPQTVAIGEPLRIIANIHIINASATRGGSIDVAIGINGAAPTGSGINNLISGGLDAVVPTSITTTDHAGLAINDTVEIWVRKATEDHVQFSPAADASSGGLHEMAVSNEAAGGGAPVWGQITGNIPDQTDLQLALNGKENGLGNPAQALQFLTSSVGGNRSWDSIPSPIWGQITGNLSNQFDLQTELNNRFLKGVDLSLDKADPKIIAKLASLTNGTASFELRSSLNTRFLSIDAVGTDRSVKLTKWDSSGVAETIIELLDDGTVTINNETIATVVSPPATSSSPGKIGDIAADANFIYKTTAVNTWVRSAASTW